MKKYKQYCSQYNGIDCIGFADEYLSRIFKMPICDGCAVSLYGTNELEPDDWKLVKDYLDLLERESKGLET